MLSCLQRVTSARVVVDGRVVGEIGPGLLVLLGVATGDTPADAARLADKIIDLRIFDDAAGKMNRSLAEAGGSMLVVSQFTLLADCRKGRRPSYAAAAAPEMAETLYEAFVAHARGRNIKTSTGIFRAQMEVNLTNDGPVTIMLNSQNR